MEHGKSHVPFLIDFDYIEDESDEERRGQDSSEDELDIILHGTPEQKRKLTRSLSRGSLELSSSEDEFEKEMEKELNETMRLHEQQYSASKQDEASCSGASGGASATGNSGGQDASKENQQSLAQQFYDDIYFDSDSDSGGEGQQQEKKKKDKKKQKLKHRMMTDDELLYDPNIDDENQRWVDRQRQKYRNQQTRNPPPKNKSENGSDDASRTQNNAGDAAAASSSVPSMPKSDAILNCPACLTTLCLDCQRHELYHNQYRAMFVLNCTIIRSERLKYPVPKKTKRWKKNRGKRKHGEDGEGSSGMAGNTGEADSEELYFPVKCGVCNTEVGMYDEDEVYHFFNVLTSTA